MSEDPRELQGFYEETVAPLAAYDEQYETELVRTLETFLDADGNVARTAEKLFTHRHTIRYRLERVKELTGLDVGSTDGRERLEPGPEGDASPGHRPPRRPSLRKGQRSGPRAEPTQAPLAPLRRWYRRESQSGEWGNGGPDGFGPSRPGSNPGSPAGESVRRVREHMFAMPPRGPRYTEAQARQAVADSMSYAEALRRLGMRAAGGNQLTLQKYVKIWGIPTDHFDPDLCPAAAVAPARRHTARGDPGRELALLPRQPEEASLRDGLKQRSCELAARARTGVVGGWR